MQLVGACQKELKSYNFMPLVTKEAWRSWRMLPIHTRSWIAVEDMIVDGLRWVEMDGLKYYDPKRGCSLLSFLCLGLNRFFQTEYGQRYMAYQRCEAQTVSIQDREQWYREQGLEFEMERAFRMPIEPQKEVEQRGLNCFAIQQMIELYRNAPKQLQQKIREWFLGGASWRRAEPKWHTHTVEFRRQAGRFRTMALRYGVGLEECRHLMCSPRCLDRMSRELFWVPYDFDRLELEDSRG